jgi:hypothetical protein
MENDAVLQQPPQNFLTGNFHLCLVTPKARTVSAGQNHRAEIPRNLETVSHRTHLKSLLADSPGSITECFLCLACRMARQPEQAQAQVRDKPWH